jgi:transcriptional regulator with XRE-family HTH domain
MEAWIATLAPLIVGKEASHQLQAFGDLLKELRAKHRIGGLRPPLSVGSVAKVARLPRATLRKYEQGRTWQPDPVHMLRLANVYKVDVGLFISALQANRENPDLTVDDTRRLLQYSGRSHEPAPSTQVDLGPVRRRLTEIAAQLLALSERFPGDETGIAESSAPRPGKRGRKDRR